MDKNDYDGFAQMLDDAYDLIGSGQNKIISAGAKRLFFRALERFSLDAISQALTAHCLHPKRGQFVPKPADLIFQIDCASPGYRHFGVEEAWAICLPAADETETVVWTDEMAAAFEACRTLLIRGDEVAARMAFKETYKRLADRAVRELTAPRWFPSLGTNRERRAHALQAAARAGLLDEPLVAGLLPAPVAEHESDKAGIQRLRAEMARLRPASLHAAERHELARQAALQCERDAVREQKKQVSMQVTDFVQDPFNQSRNPRSKHGQTIPVVQESHV